MDWDDRSLRKVRYKTIRRDGITAAILHKNNLLIVKRRVMPFIPHPGYWGFVSGGRKRNERFLDSAYREILEEIGIHRSDLKLLSKGRSIAIRGDRGNVKWKNMFFVFSLVIGEIKLNPFSENKAYRWVKFSELLKEKKSMVELYENRQEILNIIERCLKS